MPLFEVEDATGRVFEMEAPDQAAAAAGFEKYKARHLHSDTAKVSAGPAIDEAVS